VKLIYHVQNGKTPWACAMRMPPPFNLYSNSKAGNAVEAGAVGKSKTSHYRVMMIGRSSSVELNSKALKAKPRKRPRRKSLSLFKNRGRKVVW
jgi:hypothetical protein